MTPSTSNPATEDNKNVDIKMGVYDVFLDGYQNVGVRRVSG